MRISTRLTLTLLAAALAPLTIVAVRDIRATRDLSDTLAASTRRIVADRVAAELRTLVRLHADALDTERRRVELVVTVQAARLTELLARDDAPAPERTYTSADFDDPDARPPGLIELPRKHYAVSPDGRRRLLPVSYAHPVFVPAPGVELDEHPRDVAALTALAPAMRTMQAADPDPIVSQFTCLESGVHAAFPGKGNYPDGYDGRDRSWYRAAAETRDTIWIVPIVDAPTRQVRMTCARPVYTPDGTLAGVTGIDVLMLRVLDRVRLPDAVAGDAVTLLVRTEEDDAGADRAMVVASRDYADGALPWRTDVDLDELVAAPGEATRFAGFVDDVTRGAAGARTMRFEGVPHVWGYAPVSDGLALVVLVPETVVDAAVSPIAAEFETHAGRQAGFVAATAAATALGMIAFAYLASKSLSRPVRRLVNAVEKVSAGDLSARAQVSTTDELRKLARAFNEMVPALERHVRMTRSLENELLSQQTLGPGRLPEIPGYDLHAETRRHNPAEPSDFLDLVMDGPDRWVIAVGDAAASGVAAALTITSARSLFRAHAVEFDDLGEALFLVNRALHADARFGQVLPLVCLSVESTGELRFVSAGPGIGAYLFEPDRPGRINSMGDGLALGTDPDAVYDERRGAAPPLGSVIVIVTDGVYVRGPRASAADQIERFREIALRDPDASAEAIARAMFDGAEATLGPATADATVVVLKRTGA